MNTWAVLAAKEAAVATGLGTGAVPALGAGSLDGFAVGALMTGACFLVLSGPRRSRRSRRRLLTAGSASQAMPAAPGGPVPAARPSARGLDAAREHPPAGTARRHPLAETARERPLIQALGDPDREVVVPGLPGKPRPAAGAADGRGQGGRLAAGMAGGARPTGPSLAAGAREDGQPGHGQPAAGARGNGRSGGTYRSRHRRPDDRPTGKTPEPRRSMPRHAAPSGPLGAMMTVFPLQPLDSAACN